MLKAVLRTAKAAALGRAELEKLAAFVGADVPEIDWTPRNAFQGAA